MEPLAPSGGVVDRRQLAEGAGFVPPRPSLKRPFVPLSREPGGGDLSLWQTLFPPTPEKIRHLMCFGGTRKRHARECPDSANYSCARTPPNVPRRVGADADGAAWPGVASTPCRRAAAPRSCDDVLARCPRTSTGRHAGICRTAESGWRPGLASRIAELPLPAGAHWLLCGNSMQGHGCRKQAAARPGDRA